MTEITTIDILMFFGVWELLYILTWLKGEPL